MAEQGTEAKLTIKEKDAIRKAELKEDFDKREYEKWLKKEVDYMELQIKYYNYQLALPGLAQKWAQMQEEIIKNQKELKEPKVEKPSKKEKETPIIKM